MSTDLFVYTVHCEPLPHWLNMELIWAPCAAVLIGWDPATSPPPSFGLIYEGAIGHPRQMTSLCDPLLSFRFNTYSISVTHFWEYTHFVKPLETKRKILFLGKRGYSRKEKNDCVVEKGKKGESLITFIWFADSWEARIRHHRKLEDRDGGDIREDYVRYTRYRKLDKINPLPVKKK